MLPFRETLLERVILFDGAMGTQLQAATKDPADWQGRENCSEVLNLTRPDVVGAVHAAYLAAGSDVVETNTFGAHSVALDEFGLADHVSAINRRAVEIARAACEQHTTIEKPRYVAGSMGPGSKLPSLGQGSWRQLEDAYLEQATALLQAGVDVLLVETCQDPLQLRAAVSASFSARERLGLSTPVMAQITLERAGTMLVGTDVTAALAVLEAFDLLAVGLNCATGPDEMRPHLAWMCRHTRKAVSAQPNAGLPEMVQGRAHYPLTPDAFAEKLLRLVVEEGVNLVGGCCGTTPAHIAALHHRLGNRAPVPREISFEPSVSSLYTAVSSATTV